jgi:hypothetical protein
LLSVLITPYFRAISKYWKYKLKFVVKQNLTDQYIQNWFNQIENSSRGEFYGIFKNEFNLDKYLLKLIEVFLVA